MGEKNDVLKPQLFLLANRYRQFKMKTINLTILILLSINLFGQGDYIIKCDSIKIFSGLVDNKLQEVLDIPKYDTMLVINHCNSLNGCRGWGIIYWIENGNSFFQILTIKNKKISIKRIRSKRVRKYLESFYTNELCNYSGKIEHLDSVWIDHPPLTRIYYRNSNFEWCFNLADTWTLKEKYKNDKRVLWVLKLREIMK